MAGRAISVRLDGEAEYALRLLMSGGRSRSEAIRDALVAEARRENRRLREEAEALAADGEDRAEMAEVAALMESLRAAR